MLVSATNCLNHEDNVVLAVQSLTTLKKGTSVDIVLGSFSSILTFTIRVKNSED